MKLKYSFIFIIFIFLCFSISQIFSIFPFPEDIFKYYKSGYFNELDRNFKTIADSFLFIKSSSKTTYGWVFLDDIKKKYNITVKVYNKEGFHIPVDGALGKKDSDLVLKLLNNKNIEYNSEIVDNKYIGVYSPLYSDNCLICHFKGKKGEKSGVLLFQRDYDSHIYYSGERVLIFSILSIILLIMFFLAIRWDPEKNIKELFDK